MKKYTKKYFEEMGRQGGEKTKQLHGLKHFKKIRKIKRKVLSQKQAQKEQIVDKVV